MKHESKSPRLVSRKGRGIARRRQTGETPAAPSGVSGVGGDTVITTYGDAPPNTTIHWGNSGIPQENTLYIFFWGDAWASNPPPDPSPQALCEDIAKILASPYLTGLRQYYVFSPPKSITKAVVVTGGIGPNNGFKDWDVQQFVTQQIEFHGIDFSLSALYFVMMPPGINPGGFPGAHSAAYEFINMMDVHVAYVSFGTRDQITALFSHELVEILTDPEGDSLQVEPTDSNNWHEIADVCSSPDRVNGVLVQSYWSDMDKSCIIPQDVPVWNRQITCIHKGMGTTISPQQERAMHLNPHLGIKAVGGISIETGARFTKTRDQVITEIERGVRYFVVGPDGVSADVTIKTVFPPWEPWGVKCIATVADQSTENNLLSLPECT